MTDASELSEAERRALVALRRELTPPANIERRVIGALRARGLIVPASSLWRNLIVAATIAITFGAGVLSQQAWSLVARRDTPKFILLLYGASNNAGLSRRQEYASWARSMTMLGAVVEGEELGADQVEMPGSQSPRAAPLSPRGFFIVSAATMEQAEQLAASCPHLRHGGSIVVKPIIASP